MRDCSLGKVVLDLPPERARGNPRNSEGAFLTLQDGSVLFAFTRYRGESAEDYATADLCALISRDHGETFGEMRTLLTCEEENAVNIMSISLMHMADGEIGMFYLVRENRIRLQMYLRRSADGGQSWGARVLCTPSDGFFVVNNDRVVRLRGGEILIPAASHDGPAFPADEYAVPVFFSSGDDGRTWKYLSAGGAGPGRRESASGMQEPGVLELADGRLWSWARTDQGMQYESFSSDGGRSWSPARPSRFTGPKSPLCMKRSPDGSIYAVWNPFPEEAGSPFRNGVFLGGRTPYVLAVSRDDGCTFSEPMAFETEADAGYCYCAIHFLEDSLLLAYCAGNIADGSCLARCRIRKISMEQITKELESVENNENEREDILYEKESL